MKIALVTIMMLIVGGLCQPTQRFVCNWVDENDCLRSELSASITKLHAQERELIDLKKELSNLKEQCDETQTVKHNRSFVGFTAYKESTQKVAKGVTVTFTGVLVNKGGHYNSTSSHFRCPHTGIYLIALNFKLNNSAIITLSLVKSNEGDREVIFNLYNGNNVNHWNIASGSVVTQCLEGEFISVQCYYSSSSQAVYGDPGVPQTTFSVALLYNEDNTNDSFVGFTSTKQSHQDYTTLDTTTFEDVLLNRGNSYQADLSRFVCPFDGIFYSSVTLIKRGSTALKLATFQESVQKFHFEDTSSMSYNTLNAEFLIKCSKGEHLLVKATGKGSVISLDGSFSPENGNTSFVMAEMYRQDADQRHNLFAGFTAYKRSTQFYSPSDTIAFDGVLVNEGGFYQPIPSRFVCPWNGIYYVSVTAKKSGSNPLQIQVERNSIPFLKIIETYARNQGNTVGNSGLIRCLKGQDISVKAADTGAVLGDPDKVLTTFTIMIMHED